MNGADDTEIVQNDLKRDNINQKKQELKSLIDSISHKIKLNLDNIQDVNEKHTEFIIFVDIMKVHELYKWTNLKLEYNSVKKHVTKDKKAYHTISKLYGKIINYYQPDEINNLNMEIKSIYDLNETMIYKFTILKKLHEESGNKCKYMIKNPNIIKIEYLTNEIKPLVTKLYENYIGIKLLNKHLSQLKNVKSNLLHEICQINEQK